MSEGSIEVVGGQLIGEKATMLKEHEPAVIEVGLTIPPTIVVASEAVKAHLGHINEHTADLLIRAGIEFEPSPALAIRSSGEGDASAIGVYESRFAANVGGSILRNAGVVIGSFSTDSAQHFRSKTGYGEEFALMVQPVVGVELSRNKYWESFGPLLSGFGYSSSRKHPEGYLNVVAGIGGGVSRKGGLLITAETLDTTNPFEENDTSFFGMLRGIEFDGRMDPVLCDFIHGDGIFPITFTDGDAALAHYLSRAVGETEYDVHENGLISATNIDGEESDLTIATKIFEPKKFFETMKRLERIVGYPVYIEWATQIVDGKLQLVVLQIAPAQLTSREKIESEIEGKKVIEAEHLLGHGIIAPKKIVAIGTHIDLEHLHLFNKNPDNEGYVLVFSSLVALGNSNRPLMYSDCSRAGALIEIQGQEILDRHQNGNIVNHLFGASDVTGQFIGKVSQPEAMDLWGRIYSEGRDWRGSEVSRWSEHGRLKVLDGDFKVLADEKLGKFIVTEEPAVIK